MKITYYQNQIEEAQFKIKGEHSFECWEKYNNKNNKKSMILYNYEEFEKKCFDEFNKQDHCERSDFIDVAYEIMNDNKISIKNK